MKKSVLLIALLSAGVAFAGPPAPHKGGIESKDYKWNAQEGEKIEALKLKGDKPLMPNYPKVAGQNAAYAEQQMKDIKSGARNNGQTAAMKGVMHLVSDEEIKALADYLSKMK